MFKYPANYLRTSVSPWTVCNGCYKDTFDYLLEVKQVRITVMYHICIICRWFISPV